MALAGKGADIYVANGTANAVTAQAMTAVSVAAGLANGAVITSTQWYRPTTQARRAADPGVAPTVKVDGVTATLTTDYTFEPAGGIVKFVASQGASVITMDYSYLTISQLGGGKEWSLNMEREIFDATAFGASWKAKVLGDLSGEASLSKWWLDASILNVIADIAAGPSSQKNPVNRLFLSLYTDFTNNLRYESYGWLKSDAVKVAIGSLMTEDLSLETEGAVTYANW